MDFRSWHIIIQTIGGSDMHNIEREKKRRKAFTSKRSYNGILKYNGRATGAKKAYPS